MLTPDFSKKTFPIFLVNSASTEGPTSSSRENQSSAWPSISELNLVGGVAFSFTSALSLGMYLFLKNHLYQC